MFDGLQIDRIAFTIPIGDGFPIFWYGILITIGIAIGAWWAAREIEKRRQSVDDLYNGLILVVFSGYLFARLTYVLLDVIDGAQYNSFLDIINIRSGGVNILGGFAGAVLVGLWYVSWRKLRFWHYADVAGPALLIAQAIGRWGNFINQELYGPPTGSNWGILIDPAFRLPQYRDLGLYPAETTRFHPTFFYESVALFVGFIFLVWLNNRYRGQWKPGTLFAIFMIWWGGNRTWIEFFRPDQPTIGNSFLTYSMLVAFIIALVGVYLLLQRLGKLPDKAARRRSKRVAKPKPRRD
jgi:phosphatidylglycerol:prolipoprotein diacylglycerol transferase